MKNLDLNNLINTFNDILKQARQDDKTDAQRCDEFLKYYRMIAGKAKTKNERELIDNTIQLLQTSFNAIRPNLEDVKENQLRLIFDTPENRQKLKIQKTQQDEGQILRGIHLKNSIEYAFLNAILRNAQTNSNFCDIGGKSAIIGRCDNTPIKANTFYLNYPSINELTKDVLGVKKTTGEQIKAIKKCIEDLRNRDIITNFTDVVTTGKGKNKKIEYREITAKGKVIKDIQETKSIIIKPADNTGKFKQKTAISLEINPFILYRFEDIEKLYYNAPDPRAYARNGLIFNNWSYGLLVNIICKPATAEKTKIWLIAGDKFNNFLNTFIAIANGENIDKNGLKTTISKAKRNYSLKRIYDNLRNELRKLVEIGFLDEHTELTTDASGQNPVLKLCYAGYKAPKELN